MTRSVGRPSDVRPTSVSQFARYADALPSEAILRRQYQVRFVAGLLQRRHQRAGDDQVAALDKRRARRDDGDGAHGTSSGFTSTPR